jgi:tetratricopeptide (TPR) repeat protein
MRNWMARAHNALWTSAVGALSRTRRPLAHAAKLHPRVEPLYTLGQTQAATGDTDAAIATLRSILIIDPNHAEARIALATLLSGSGDAVGALVEIDAVLQRDPRNLRALSVKGHIEAACGRVDAAIDSFRQVTADQPEAAADRIALANVLSEKGEQSQAVAELDAALQGACSKQRRKSKRPWDAVQTRSDHLNDALNSPPTMPNRGCPLGTVISAKPATDI